MGRQTVEGKVAPFPRRKQSSFGILKLITAAGLFMLSVFFALIVVQMVQYSRLYRELAAVELQVTEKESRNEAIIEEIERLNDTGYIGTLARKLLGLVRPGEIVFQLED